jgi:hypothetical protein
MAADRPDVFFREREFRGSRFRCLLATHQSNSGMAAFLNSLVSRFASVDENVRHMPAGFAQPNEAMLSDSANGFLSANNCADITRWWLVSSDHARTPNWDLVSTCMIDGRPGLILVEAKAHEDELKADDACGAGEKNRPQIEAAIRDASQQLGLGWNLSTHSHYQLSNRFAWAWKLASLRIPVVLVYLGFLNANEMSKPFRNHESWESCLRRYSEKTLPQGIWNSSALRVNDTPLIPLIRSADVNVAIQQFS